MPNGTTLNDVFAARIHRSNAAEVKADAERMLQYYKEKLIAMAAATPAPTAEGGANECLDELCREVNSCIDEMREEWWREFCAQYILDFPDEVVDDFDNIGGTP